MFARFIENVKTRITSNTYVANEPAHGINFEFVFGGEHTKDDFKAMFLEAGADKLEGMQKVTQAALHRTPEERLKYIKHLSSPEIRIVIGKGARRVSELKKSVNQFIINVNAMSESNLTNMLEAIQEICSK